jgi:hypothetical protein
VQEYLSQLLGDGNEGCSGERRAKTENRKPKTENRKPTERSLVGRSRLARDDQGRRWRRSALVRLGVFSDETAQDLQLALGDADFAVEGEEKAVGAGVAEIGAGDGGVGLDGGRQSGAEIGAFLHRGENGVADFLFEHVPERTGAEEFPKGTIGLDGFDFGNEAHGAGGVDGGRELDYDLRVAGDELVGDTGAGNFGAGPALVMKLNGGEAGGLDGDERGVLDGDAIAAFIGTIELRLQQPGEIVLEVGEIGAEAEFENVLIALFGDAGDGAEGGDGDGLAGDFDGASGGRDFEDDVLRAGGRGGKCEGDEESAVNAN